MIEGSKNKGDWSEFYALVYALGHRRLFAADESLSRIPEVSFPILKIFRHENAQNQIDFVLKDSNTIQVFKNSELFKTLKSEDFISEAERLSSDISEANGPQFVIPHGEEFLNSIGCRKLAAPSNDVTDIRMQVHDPNTGTDQIMGFSIKSYLGSAPTLLNASGATNFVYEVTGINDDLIDEINQIDTRTKILDRIAAIHQNGGTITFVRPDNAVFSGNLKMIDTQMENIIAEMLLYTFSTGVKDCGDLVNHLEDVNPLSYPWRGFYAHKVKEFLCAKALGMDPSKRWSGTDDANGGYIVVKSDGEVVAYHIYNRDKFKQYLYDNTYFDRASTSRHGYASLYKEGERVFIKLNIQIRFREK